MISLTDQEKAAIASLVRRADAAFESEQQQLLKQHMERLDTQLLGVLTLLRSQHGVDDTYYFNDELTALENRQKAAEDK